jgi:hypothetical protein
LVEMFETERRVIKISYAVGVPAALRAAHARIPS